MEPHRDRKRPCGHDSPSVQTPCGLVDGSDYQLALACDQDALFGDDDPSEAARLYALLLHSPFRGRNDAEQREFAYLPGSVYVAFPASGIQYYVHYINLFARFPDVIDQMMPNQWDEIGARSLQVGRDPACERLTMPSKTPGFVGARLREAREVRNLRAVELSEIWAFRPKQCLRTRPARSRPSPAISEVIWCGSQPSASLLHVAR